MYNVHTVAVFCGARSGRDPAFLESARALGDGLAKAGIRLVYGGGRIGMMGVLADAALEAGGAVIGVIPTFLADREKAHKGVADMIFTDTMHARKRQMFDKSDAFLILPGGLGTLDEAAEILTWKQLGLHHKPILICDIKGWARPFAALLESYVEEGFVAPEGMTLYEILPDVASALARLRRIAVPEESDRSALL
jgi:uncharacterized protein (TIGR00730 family)